MAETKVAKKTKKSKESIQETEVKASALAEKETTAVADDVKVVEDNVQVVEDNVQVVEDNVQVVEDNIHVDVEIDCRSCSNSSNQCVYIRRKRSI